MAQRSHREDLLEGAIRCLQAKGYAGASARDIAREAGASLASIGYHFGSKDALLAKALIREFGEWVRTVGQIALAAEDTSSPARAGAALAAARESFQEHQALLGAFVEAMAQARHSDELRQEMAELYREGRRAVGGLVRASLGERATTLGADPSVVASVVIAIVDGLALQWLLDADDTPGAEELASAFASLFVPGAASSAE